MKLSIQRHIHLKPSHPKLPSWLFSRDNIIMSQTIKLGESDMKELLLFLQVYAEDFIMGDISVSIRPFSEIKLIYRNESPITNTTTTPFITTYENEIGVYY